MRVALAIPLLLLGACQVSKDDNNGTMSVTYNSDVAENALADAGNTAENVAGDIGNNVKEEGGRLQDKINNTDVDVNVKTNTNTSNTAENKSQ